MEIFDALLVTGAGLNDLWTSILRNWVTPVFLAMIAFFAFGFLKNRQWMQLIAFVGIAAVVSVLVYGGAALFGENGSLNNVIEENVKKINTVVVTDVE